jgi:hypothetical protein
MNTQLNISHPLLLLKSLHQKGRISSASQVDVRLKAACPALARCFGARFDQGWVSFQAQATNHFLAAPTIFFPFNSPLSRNQQLHTTMASALRLSTSALRSSLTAPAFNSRIAAFNGLRCYSSKTQVNKFYCLTCSQTPS